MAQKTTVVLVDDIDQSDADETIYFSLDNVSYQIDLNAAHAQQLRDAMAPWIKAGRRVAGRRRRGTTAATAANRELSRKVRAWAEANGIPINKRGRIPANLIEQYRRAN